MHDAELIGGRGVTKSICGA